MNDERRCAGRLHRRGEGEQRFARLLVVDADATFDRDGNVRGARHRPNAICRQRRLPHQAGAESAALDPVGGAAAVEVDLVIAEVRADAGGFREAAGLRPAELQRDRMLGGVEADQALARPEHDRVGRHHFRIEAGAATQQAMEGPAPAVRPVHHRRNGELGAIRAIHEPRYKGAGGFCPVVAARGCSGTTDTSGRQPSSVAGEPS